MYRIPKFWRDRDLDILLHELDEVFIQEQVDNRSKTKAMKSLRRGPYIDIESADEGLEKPPTGFPKSLVCPNFMDNHVTRAEELTLKLSTKEFDLTELIAHTKWLQSKN